MAQQECCSRYHKGCHFEEWAKECEVTMARLQHCARYQRGRHFRKWAKECEVTMARLERSTIHVNPPRKASVLRLVRRKAPRRQSSFAFSHTEGFNKYVANSLHGKPEKKKKKKKGKRKGDKEVMSSPDPSACSSCDPSDPGTSSGYSWEVRANDRQHGNVKKTRFLCSKRGRSDNRIKTAKYNVVTFLPLNLFEQYHRGIIIYFTCVVIIQSIPEIANLPIYVYLVPLICILTARAIRDLINDIARHRSDNLVNNSPCDILMDGGLQPRTWKDVQVGDIVCVRKDQFVPADMLLLYSTEPNSLCYVETAGIDGETNLKFRQSLAVTHSGLDTIEALAAFDGLVTCEAPNAQIHSFVGVLDWKGKKYPLNSDNLLLRDCRLRNTAHCFGLVIYAGFETKIMKNSGKMTLKFTETDRVINQMVAWTAVFVLVVCFLLGIGAGVWDRRYLENHFYLPRHPQYSSAVFGVLMCFGYFGVICSLVPFYQYLSLEVLYMMHTYFICNDLDMYYEENDMPAQARGHSCSDMLGQIQYIFADKTGTLTQNLMTFKKCCIGNRIFGTLSGEEQSNQEVSFQWNRYADPAFRFYDQTLIEELQKDPGDPQVHEFFRAIALCHTVMVDGSKEGVTYKSTSPDEEALVTAGKNFGYVFLSRTQETITISEMGTVRTYSILALMDFTSDRKRMSILVRSDEGKVKLYSKGADSVILERLHPACDSKTIVEALEDFSEETLRTLCLAYKDLEEEDYLAWKTRHHEASLSLEKRQQHLDKVYEDMEKDLQLLGATAIEDKLQVGVEETMQRLRDAAIKVWMLTGDKKETAVNIAYSSNLLSSNMELIHEEDIGPLLESSQWDDANMAVEMDGMAAKANQKKALVVTGDFLNGFFATTAEEPAEIPPWWKKLLMRLLRKKRTDVHSNPKAKALVEVACRCHAVICCRVTPQQKASIVQLVKTNKKVTTLAIGDGGNDVNMIKTAHIGIGVAGKEGLQAVLASEYAVAQFSYLQNLLLFHGRLSLARITKFLCYTNYRTFTVIIYNIWFAFFNAFSSLPLFDGFFFLFIAIVYTLTPPLCMGILYRDVDSKTSREHPELYRANQKGGHLGWKVFLFIVYSFYTTLVIFFLTYLVFRDSAGPGGIFDYQVFTFTINAMTVMAVTAEVILEMSSWTWVTLVVVVLAFGSYFPITYLTTIPSAFYYKPSQFNFVGSFVAMFGSGYIWLLLLLGVTLCIAPSLMCRFAAVLIKEPPRKASVLRLLRRKAPRRQSSFAFSHTEGFNKYVANSLHGKPEKKKKKKGKRKGDKEV
ncbi:phospholipid-transporting ATPase IC-like [Gastrophryne carolinensis]